MLSCILIIEMLVVFDWLIASSKDMIFFRDVELVIFIRTCINSHDLVHMSAISSLVFLRVLPYFLSTSQ